MRKNPGAQTSLGVARVKTEKVSKRGGHRRPRGRPKGFSEPTGGRKAAVWKKTEKPGEEGVGTQLPIKRRKKKTKCDLMRKT